VHLIKSGKHFFCSPPFKCPSVQKYWTGNRFKRFLRVSVYAPKTIAADGINSGLVHSSYPLGSHYFFVGVLGMVDPMDSSKILVGDSKIKPVVSISKFHFSTNQCFCE